MSPLAALAIGLGGSLGALARWRLDLLLRRVFLALVARRPHSERPERAPAVLPLLGIGVVNVCGSFLLGLASGLVDPDGLVRALLATGFLGGFTTFSTAVMDCQNLWRAGRRIAAGALLVGVWAVSLLALVVGLAFSGALT